MKNSLILLWFCFITISLSGQPGQLQVGTACVDVSPKVIPFQLRSGKSSYVHDPLHVRAVAFESAREEDHAHNLIYLSVIEKG